MLIKRVLLGGFCMVALSGQSVLAQEQPELPSYYPEDYSQLVEASKEEDGLLVYSVMAAYNWAPVLEGFKEKYPWIEVETLDMGSELWDRYYTEAASGARTGDMIAAFGIDGWLDLNERGEIVPYESPEEEYLPEWAAPFPGAYALSADPAIIVWNKQLLPEGARPCSMEAIVELAQREDSNLDGKLVTYDAGAGAVTSVWSWVWAQGQEDQEQVWDYFEVLGPMSRVERSGGVMVEKLTTGEYALAYLMSAINLLPVLDETPVLEDLLGWCYFEDTQPLYTRLMAVTEAASSPASSKLLLDHILSHEGQVAFGAGGLAPARTDVSGDDVAHHSYSSIVEEVGGEDEVHVMHFDPAQPPQIEAFVERWEDAYNR